MLTIRVKYSNKLSSFCYFRKEIDVNTEIIIALISGISVAIPSLIATLFSNYQNNKKQEENKKLTIYRLEELEKKMNQYNHVMEKIYSIEADLKNLKEDIRELKNNS